MFIIFVSSTLHYLSTEYLYQVILTVVCAIITTVCAANLPRDNKTIVRIKGQLLGLQKYIKVARKHQIEQMARINPQQFFDILPYAYILGVTDIWLKKFQHIIESNPEMFKSNYNLRHVSGFTKSLLTVTGPSYHNGGLKSSSSSSGYHSSFGGGGHSGGGGGGGGGHSW